jgi:aryl-alcohol dehydrogenase-like predicted oxidoreductase
MVRRAPAKGDDTMQYRAFGNTGLKVSEVGLGAGNIGYVSQAQAEQVLNMAIDMGVTLIDTAASYLDSEARIGKYLSHRKEEFVIATKCGTYETFVDGERQTRADYTPDGVLRTIDGSRGRLKTDVLDIVQFHHLPADREVWKGAFEALLEAKSRGWTRFVGVSEDGQAAMDAATQWPLDSEEFTYNVFVQDPAADLMPLLRERKMGTIIKGPIAHGIYKRADRPEGVGARKIWDRARQSQFKDLVADSGMPLVEFILRFTLSNPDVCTAIVGTTRPDHLQANVRVSDGGKLPDEICERAKRLFERTD